MSGEEVWEVSPDLPPGTKAARDLLLRDPVRPTEDDRTSLHRFFRPPTTSGARTPNWVASASIS